MHSGSIDAGGKKDFNTILHLTNGVDLASDNASDILYPTEHSPDANVAVTYEKS